MGALQRAFRSITAFAAGAGFAYFYDPDRGLGRRKKLRDQAGARLRRLARETEKHTIDLRNRATGTLHELTHEESPPANDQELSDKVRSEVLGRPEFRHLDVVVDSANGVVHLRGPVADSEVRANLEAAVEDVNGVVRVESYLHKPGHPAPNKAEVLRASR